MLEWVVVDLYVVVGNVYGIMAFIEHNEVYEDEVMWIDDVGTAIAYCLASSPQSSGRNKTRNMKTVCLKCNKPLELHRKYTIQDIEAAKNATYERPVNGQFSPLSSSLIGQWVGHDPMMSITEPTWPTPFGVTETTLPVA